MSETIACRLNFVDARTYDKIKQFLDSLDLFFDDNEMMNKSVFIEVKTLPKIITSMESAGCFLRDKKPGWDIVNINENAITLWYIHPVPLDAHILIPMSNIIAFHTIDDHYLSAIRESSLPGPEIEATYDCGYETPDFKIQHNMYHGVFEVIEKKNGASRASAGYLETAIEELIRLQSSSNSPPQTKQPRKSRKIP